LLLPPSQTLAPLFVCRRSPPVSAANES
jgi:hypothetical protein